MNKDIKIGNKDLYTKKKGYYLIIDDVFNIKVSKKNYTKVRNYLNQTCERKG